MSIRILTGDCRARMAELPESSIDAIVCDPPYGLEFMGQEWDRLSGDPLIGKARATGFDSLAEGAPDKRPGNAGGTRFGSRAAAAPNYYRTTNAKCRKCNRWRVSGGHDGRGNTLGCKCDEPDFPNARADASRRMQDWHASWAVQALRVLKPGGHLLAFGGTRTYHRLMCALEDTGFEIRDCIAWLYGSGFPKSRNLGDGWGTALKPAHEPIVVARKPLSERNLAANVERWGTGGMNIDGCRIAVGEHDHSRAGEPSADRRSADRGGTNLAPLPGPRGGSPDGRWPANVTLDEEAASILDAQTGDRSSNSGDPFTRNSDKFRSVYSAFAGTDEERGYYGDTGGVSRFFYCAKAGRAERNAGLDGVPERALNWSPGEQSPGTFQAEGTHRAARNHHPTVKPVDLMRWLVRLVCPPGGTVLDPFMGSGTTGMACGVEGFAFIGIEEAPEYAEIARRRIVHAVGPLVADVQCEEPAAGGGADDAE